jgi:hypothetical protein
MLNYRREILLLTAFRQEIYSKRNVSSLIPMLDDKVFKERFKFGFFPLENKSKVTFAT